MSPSATMAVTPGGGVLEYVKVGSEPQLTFVSCPVGEGGIGCCAQPRTDDAAASSQRGHSGERGSARRYQCDLLARPPRRARGAKRRHLIPGTTFKGASCLLLVLASPLFEKERYLPPSALIAEIRDPSGIHRPRAGT